MLATQGQSNQRILGFPDASYRNNSDKSSQRAHVIYLAEERQPYNSRYSEKKDSSATRGSIIGYESHKITTTTQSTTVAELQALMKCFGPPCSVGRCQWSGSKAEGGHSSPELGDKCRHRETNVQARWRQMQRLARTHVKDCKAEADTAAQSWETNVKDCKAKADTAAQSWETSVKDCKDPTRPSSVGFPAGLSPTCFHSSPSFFHLSPRLDACGRVPGWL